MTWTLVLGTRNRKKVEEIRDLLGDLLGDLSIRLTDLSAYPGAPEVVEDGSTFAQNAAKKASEVAAALGQWVLAEDSGLVVTALNGRPGVLSARFAGVQGDDAANNRLLLEELAAVPDEQRGAHYVCSAALSDPHGHIVATAEGRCHGRIIRDYRGSGGFGYDPLFLIPEYHQTFGELSLRVKQALSHRGKAITQLRPELSRLAASFYRRTCPASKLAG